MDTGKGGQLLPPYNLDTVRALHQTVVSLRTALDKSRSELQALRVKVQAQADTNVYAETIEKLSIENHILRQRVLTNGKVPGYLDFFEGIPRKPTLVSVEIDTKHMEQSKSETQESEKLVADANSKESHKVVLEEREQSGEEPSEEKRDAPEKLGRREPSIRSEDGERSFCSETSQPDAGTLQGSKAGGESDNESEELDDIELIFTTEETKELGVLREDLVSITESDSWHPGSNLIKLPGVDSLEEVAEDGQEEDEDDEVMQTEDYHSSEKLRSNLTKTWTHSVLVETDISKCGVVDENDVSARIGRRNTLPNPLIYHPIVHREALTGSRSQLLGPAPLSPRPLAVKFSVASNPGQSPRSGRFDFGKSPVRPILIEKNSAKRESEAQTDITALPSQWRSESYLAHKVSHNFTTLPSKFALPIQQATKLRKQGGLFSLISISRAWYQNCRAVQIICVKKTWNRPTSRRPSICAGITHRAFTYMKNTDMVSPGYMHSRDFGKDPWSPCNCAQSGLMHYGGSQSKSDFYQSTPRYRGSLTSMSGSLCYEPLDPRRRHSWKPSYEMYQSSTLSQRPTWGSMPSSPTHAHRSRSVPFTSSYVTPAPRSDVNLYSWTSGRESQYSISSIKSSKLQPSKNRPKNKVTFQESSLRRSTHPGQSLPDLRVDLDIDSGDSTDSLIDEAEEYLRRSIDSILTGADWGKVGRRRLGRKYSEPDHIRELVPPKSAKPFLPKIPRDLKLDYFVKIISNEGRVMVGRVRYMGNVPGRVEPHVGVELPQDSGDCDGSFQGRRFFDCDPGKGLFVPFKKVVMAWSI
uniref:CAP-Gly domain-containing protein n=1 Tax=Timema bartmani TaxID=61472 RepID=A0A7R9F5L5_9NEOP|nr:unnamed protein product [Timema bartmani]